LRPGGLHCFMRTEGHRILDFPYCILPSRLVTLPAKPTMTYCSAIRAYYKE